MENIVNNKSNLIPYNRIVRPVTGYIIRITPDLASYWLTKNLDNNRKPKGGTVELYASDMRSGNFGLNPDAIAFDEDGNLFNGQHRLRAIVKTGVTLDAFVIFDFHMGRNDFLNVDTGKKRSIRDGLEIAGVDDELVLRAMNIAASYMRVKGSIHGMVSSSERINFINANREIMQWACNIGKHGNGGGGNGSNSAASRIPSVFIVAMIDAKLCGESEDALQRFANVYLRNDFDGTACYSPRYAIELRDSNLSRKHTVDTLNHAKSAINAFARKLTKMYIRDNLYPAPRLKSGKAEV